MRLLRDSTDMDSRVAQIMDQIKDMQKRYRCTEATGALILLVESIESLREEVAKYGGPGKNIERRNI